MPRPSCLSRDSSSLRSSAAAFLVLAALSASPATAQPSGDESRATARSPEAAQALGLDVSHFQGEIDWAAVAASGTFAFAFVKATEGVDALDPQFQNNWQGAKQAGLIRGAYHFFEPEDDPMQQVDFFLGTVGDFEPGDLPPVVDVELSRDVAAKDLLDALTIWLEAVAAATGRVPMIYTDLNFWNSLATDAFGAYPLWLAEYEAEEATLELPSGWNAWLFWQYEDEGQVDGIDTTVDLDRFAGDRKDLQRFAGGRATP